MPEARKLLPRVALVLVLATLVVATLVWWRAQRQPKEIVLSGTLEARTVEVGSLTGGRVVRVLVDEGQHVAAGQLLVQLETTTIDRQLDEQRAAIEAARANLAKALAGPRQEEIAQAAAVAANAKASAEQLLMLKRGTRKEDIDAARAEVEQQQRRLATLMKQRAETDVAAPNAGTVQSMVLRPGDLVAPNQPVAEILEPSELWVRVYVPETELHLVHVGQPVHIRIDSGETFPGHIATVAGKGEYTPRNVQTRAQRVEEVFAVKVIVDPNPKLKAGMAADVDLGVKGTPE